MSTTRGDTMLPRGTHYVWHYAHIMFDDVWICLKHIMFDDRFFSNFGSNLLFADQCGKPKPGLNIRVFRILHLGNMEDRARWWPSRRQS